MRFSEDISYDRINKRCRPKMTAFVFARKGATLPDRSRLIGKGEGIS
jgi:hypothetical protein